MARSSITSMGKIWDVASPKATLLYNLDDISLTTQLTRKEIIKHLSEWHDLHMICAEDIITIENHKQITPPILECPAPQTLILFTNDKIVEKSSYLAPSWMARCPDHPNIRSAENLTTVQLKHEKKRNSTGKKGKDNRAAGKHLWCGSTNQRGLQTTVKTSQTFGPNNLKNLRERPSLHLNVAA